MSEGELRWIASRVRDGLPVSVDIVMDGLGVCEPRAQELMAGDWPALIDEVAVLRPTLPAAASVAGGISTPPAAPLKCPRCERVPVLNHDVVECLVHGTIDEPVRAWDLPASIDADSRDGKQRASRSGAPSVPWTDEERQQWEKADRGEPVMPVNAWDSQVNRVFHGRNATGVAS